MANGKIAFQFSDVAADTSRAFTIDPDGSHEAEIAKAHSGEITGDMAPAPGAWAPDSERLLLEVFVDSRVVPARTNADGSGLRILDAYPKLWESPSAAPRAWSPDGLRFLVSGSDGTPSGDGIAARRASDGGGRIQLSMAPRNCEDDPLGYSPDGSRVLFRRGCGPNGGPVTDSFLDLGTLYTVKHDGTDLIRLSPAGLEATGFRGFSADWSPDGSQVAFSGYIPSADSTALFVVNADGTGLKQIVSLDVGAVADQWSRDGTEIAFSSRFRSQPQIWIVRPDGTGLVQLTETTGGATSIVPVWSPDGTELLFQQMRSGQVTLWTMRRDGTNQTQLTTKPISNDYIFRYGWGSAPTG